MSLARRPEFLAEGCNAQAHLADGIFIGTIDDIAMDESEQAAVESLWGDATNIFGPAPVYVVDLEGVFLGTTTSPGAGQFQVSSYPPTPRHRWVGGAWVMQEALSELLERAHEQIDRAAGAARARYITVAPGQEGTYIIKAQQALAYLTDGSIVPSYIAAEAAATGLSPRNAAELINGMAVLWNDVVGPAIEQHRRAGNLAVAAATTNAAVKAALDTTLTTLGAI